VSTRRLLKAAEAVREVVSMAILTQVRDPRVRDVTVTRVEMDPDMRAATVHVSVMGSPAKEELALRGLASSAGFLQAQIAEKIETRYTPRLTFKIDGGVKKSIEIARVLREVLPPEPAETAEPGRASSAAEGMPAGHHGASARHGHGGEASPEPQTQEPA
jgi:ribosome-binding factor A